MTRREFVDLMERRGLSRLIAARSWETWQESLRNITVEELDGAFAQASRAIATAKRLERQ